MHLAISGKSFVIVLCVQISESKKQVNVCRGLLFAEDVLSIRGICYLHLHFLLFG